MKGRISCVTGLIYLARNPLAVAAPASSDAVDDKGFWLAACALSSTPRHQASVRAPRSYMQATF